MTVTLHYQSYGQGQPVVILHGLFGSSRNWSVLARKLARHYRVLTVDLRNHGQSSHAETMSYAEMAGDIRQFLVERGLEQTSLIGHSMGGKVAMTFALMYPSMVGKLAVLDIAPVAYRTEFHMLLDSMAALPLQELNTRPQADELLGLTIADRQLRQFLLQNLVQDTAGFHWRIDLGALRDGLPDVSVFPSFPAGRRYTGPALFLGGSDSRHLQQNYQGAINELFSNARIHIIKDAGHWLHIDQPEAVLKQLVAFIR